MQHCVSQRRGKGRNLFNRKGRTKLVSIMGSRIKRSGRTIEGLADEPPSKRAQRTKRRARSVRKIGSRSPNGVCGGDEGHGELVCDHRAGQRGDRRVRRFPDVGATSERRERAALLRARIHAHTPMRARSGICPSSARRLLQSGGLARRPAGSFPFSLTSP